MQNISTDGCFTRNTFSNSSVQRAVGCTCITPFLNIVQLCIRKSSWNRSDLMEKRNPVEDSRWKRSELMKNKAKKTNSRYRFIMFRTHYGYQPFYIFRLHFRFIFALLFLVSSVCLELTRCIRETIGLCSVLHSKWKVEYSATMANIIHNKSNRSLWHNNVGDLHDRLTYLSFSNQWNEIY